MSGNSKTKSKSGHKLPSALQSGAFSMLAVLPGEDQSAYDKLHRAAVEEYKPSGALEEDLVESMVRLVWRRMNLKTLRIAMLAQRRRSAVLEELVATKYPDQIEISKHPDSDEMVRAAGEIVRKEFGNLSDFAELGPEVSFDALIRELDLDEKFGVQFDRCIKRLASLKVLKSMAGESMRSIAPPYTPSPDEFPNN